MPHNPQERQGICAALNRASPERVPKVVNLKWRFDSAVFERSVVGGMQLLDRTRPVKSSAHMGREQVFSFRLQ